MIFKTKNNELAIFGKTLKNVKDKIIDFATAYEQYGLKEEHGAIAALFCNRKSANILTPELEAEFNTFQKLFNNSSKSADVLAEELNGINSSIVNYAKTCKNGELTMKGFKTSLQGMALSAKIGQAALKGLALAANVAVSFDISLAIEGLISLLDSLSTTLEEQKEKLEETKNSISNYESEINTLQNKLSENQNKINEINTNPLDIVDKNTLSTLEAENAELTQQLEIIKAIKADAEELAELQTVQILENTATTTGATQLVNSIKEGNLYENIKTSILADLD